MRREQRLARGRYAVIHRQGRVWANDLMVMKALPNQLSLSRFGFSVSKRLGKAVQRNRLKRRLREGLWLTPTQSGWDFVFIPRPAASTADYHRLKKAAESLLARARLLRKQA